MTTPNLPVVRRRWLVVRALLRAVATSAVLLVLYYVIPFDGSGGDVVVRLPICLAVLFGIIAWQVRNIINSDYPALQAIQALAATTPLYVLLFASSYYLMDKASGANFTQTLTRTDAMYFSVTVFSSVGFGDITAKSQAARLVVTAQMFLDLIVLGLAVRVFVSAVKIGQQRHSAEHEE